MIIFNNTVVAFAGENTTVCQNSVQLNAISPENGFGMWTAIQGNANFVDPTFPHTMVFDLALGLNVFRWFVQNEACVGEGIVEILNNMVITNAGPDLSIVNNSVTLQAEPLDVGEWGMWSVISGGGNVFDTIPNAVVTKYSTRRQHLQMERSQRQLCRYRRCYCKSFRIYCPSRRRPSYL